MPVLIGGRCKHVIAGCDLCIGNRQSGSFIGYISLDTAGNEGDVRGEEDGSPIGDGSCPRGKLIPVCKL